MGVDGMQAVGEMLAARARLNEGSQQKKTEATKNDESIDPVQVSSGVGC